jgi:glycine cleavage system H lipoate-binding protein
MVAIFVVLTILVCVSIDALVQRKQIPQTENQVISNLMPEQARLYSGHTWATIAAPNQVDIGIDEFVSQALGPIDRLIVRPAGTQLLQGEPMLEIERGSRSLQVKAPISGIIKKSNSQFWNQQRFLPENHPNSENWIYTIHPTNLLTEWPNLLTGQVARQWLEAEWQRLAQWLTNGHTLRTEYALQDGGLPVPGILQHLDHQEWQAFQKIFLNTSKGGDLT